MEVNDKEAKITIQNRLLKFDTYGGVRIFEKVSAEEIKKGHFILSSKKNIKLTLNTESNFSWYAWYMILIYVNALLGLTIFELKYHEVRRHMDHRFEDLHARFPHYRRLDSARWARWKFWPGAVTVFLPRLIFAFIGVICLWLGVVVLLWGHSDGKPLTGCRKCLIRTHYKFWIGFIGYVTLFAHTRTVYEKNVDYSKWLGPGELVSASAASLVRASMITPNHLGFFEIAGLVVGDVHPGFAPKIELKKIPIMGAMTRALQSIYIDRFGAKEKRDNIVN